MWGAQAEAFVAPDLKGQNRRNQTDSGCIPIKTNLPKMHIH